MHGGDGRRHQDGEHREGVPEAVQATEGMPRHPISGRYWRLRDLFRGADGNIAPRRWVVVRGCNDVVRSDGNVGACGTADSSTTDSGTPDAAPYARSLYVRQRIQFAADHGPC